MLGKLTKNTRLKNIKSLLSLKTLFLSKIDYLGSLLLIISLTGLILGILEIEATGFNQITYGYFACFILGAVWFIKHESNHSTPIVDLHLFKNLMENLF